MTEKDYSLSAFNRFFDYAAENGLMKRNTAQSRKAATNKILEKLEPTELEDLRKVNLNQAFSRFENLSGMQYKPDSLQVYLSRARTALSDFISYVDSPSSFKPLSSSKKNGASRQKNDIRNPLKQTANNEKQDNELYSDSNSYEGMEVKHIIVPIPLRENLTVKISNLPADLTQAEAERLAAIVRAYAVPVVK
ncbi:hypothetical protein A1353_13695 [Methylomonas methanica]|uniref:Core-binding (CB) domain-containing protein n=1 Tax=Methylomonas methanica TaxID=421 RepID=A0A177MH92_METMH|nr:hypothetical protein [Methylomonas methanica]OAI04310.1 hypothetical protein A1353_13695 [Methylomonas methanica]